MRQRRWPILLALALIAPVPAAQAAGTGANPATEERMLAQRRQLILKSLELDPQIAPKFWAIYDRYQAELTAIRNQRMKILSELGENYDNMSDVDAREYVMNELNLEEDRTRLAKRYVLEMAKVLSPRQLARYIQIEHKIKSFIDAGIEEEIPLIK